MAFSDHLKIFGKRLFSRDGDEKVGKIILIEGARKAILKENMAE